MGNLPPHKIVCRELAEIFSTVGDVRSMEIFLEGLLTPSELEEVICRWRLMQRLRAGQTQRQIARELGVSLGKISRGSRLLKYGSPQFRELLRKIDEQASPSS